MELLNQYITPIVALGVFLIMEIAKRTFTFDKRYIPIMSAILGVVFIQWNNGLNFSFETFLLGVVSGGSGTWIYEVIENFNKPQPIENTEVNDLEEL